MSSGHTIGSHHAFLLLRSKILKTFENREMCLQAPGAHQGLVSNQKSQNQGRRELSQASSSQPCPQHRFVGADIDGRLYVDVARLLYHVATVKATSDADNEGLIGRGRQGHRFGLSRPSSELSLLLAALGVQQRHDPDH